MNLEQIYVSSSNVQSEQRRSRCNSQTHQSTLSEEQLLEEPKFGKTKQTSFYNDVSSTPDFPHEVKNTVFDCQNSSMITEELDRSEINGLSRTISGLSNDSFSNGVESSAFNPPPQETIHEHEPDPLSDQKQNSQSPVQPAANSEQKKPLKQPSKPSTQKKDVEVKRTAEGFSDLQAKQYADRNLGKYMPSKVRFADTFNFKCCLDHKIELTVKMIGQGSWCQKCEAIWTVFCKMARKRDIQVLDSQISAQVKMRCIRGHDFTAKPCEYVSNNEREK